ITLQRAVGLLHHSEDQERGKGWKCRLDSGERICRAPRCDELPLLRSKLLRPDGKRADGRGRYSQFANRGEKLEDETFDLALQVKVTALVVESQGVGGNDD